MAGNKGSIYAAAKITKTPEQARVECTQLSLSHKTIRLYNSRVQIFHTFIEMKRLWLDPGYDDIPDNGNVDIFAHFLEHFAKTEGTRCKSTGDGYRSAILHYQRTHNLPLWASTGSCRSVVDGWHYQGKKADSGLAPVRGQVTRDMHTEMIRYSWLHCPEYTDAFDLAYRCALRPFELMSLCKGSYQDGKINIPDKRSTARNGMPPFVLKKVFDTSAKAILSRLEKDSLRKEMSYFPFSILQLRTKFRKMIVDLGLNNMPGLIFDGPHCLRHGGMAYLVSLNISADDLLVTSSTMAHYIRPNHKRARQ